MRRRTVVSREITRRNPVRSDGKRTYEKLIESALSLFSEKGYHNVSVSMIAKKSLVKTATFYQYFGGKDVIYKTILERAFDAFKAGMSDIPFSTREKFVEKFVRSYLDFYISQPLFHRVLHEGVYIDRSMFKRIEKLFTELIEKSQGVSNRLKSAAIRWFLTGPVRFVSIFKSISGDYTISEKLTAELIDFALRGIDPDEYEMNPEVLKMNVEPLRIEVSSTRMRLLQSAEKLFGSKGYRHTMILDIARGAGVAKGTFYIYFDGKKQILEELVTTTNRALRITLLSAIRKFQDRRDAEIAGYNAFVKFFMLHPKMYHIVRETEFFYPTISQDYYQRILDSYLKPLREAISSNMFRPFNVEHLALFLMGIGHFMGEDMVLRRKFTHDDFAICLKYLSKLLYKGV